ncbi:MAG: hypothetical protein A3K60_02855 [Euryarchaeota archaeon RBG_19FT_COMBO_56_21]|nr:MAG: hypothetical protein A3K60_02855 [Euryarchaeota archaeon RBG_19FT_COMBO_56_21]
MRRKKGTLPADMDINQMARILIAVYRGLTADIILGVKKDEAQDAWIEATNKLLANPTTRRSRE